MNQLTTPKSQIGINYAKLRNKTKKHNNSSIENKELMDSQKDKAKYNGIFDTMNQANLNYIETLISNKQQHRKQYDSHFELETSSKRNHQRAKSTLEEKQNKAEEQIMSYRETNTSTNDMSPNNLQASKINPNTSQHNYMRHNNLNKSSYNKPNLSVHSNHESSNVESRFPKQDTDSEKLFDQFFKLNNSKSDSDFIRENSHVQINQKTHNHMEEDDVFEQKSSGQSRSKGGIFSGDFLKFLDHSISYLQKSESDFKSLPSKFQVPLQKQISKELSHTQNENKILKHSKDQLESKLRELITAKNFLFKECQIMKQREDDYKQSMNMLKYDNHTLKKKFQELSQKCLFFEELINQQKIDNENSLIALKQVQALHSKQGNNHSFKNQSDILKEHNSQEKKYNSYNEQNFNSHLRRNHHPNNDFMVYEQQNKVIEETHSSTNDDEKVSDYQFDFELRKDNNFQTNHSQDFDSNDFLVGGKFSANQMYELMRQQKHNKMIEEDIQKMLVQKYYKSNNKKQEMISRHLESSQIHNLRKKSQRDKQFSNEVFQFFNDAQS